jgi:hypothetical protein
VPEIQEVVRSCGSGLSLALGKRGRKKQDGGDSTSGGAGAGKLLTDENFRERFFTNPEIAIWEVGNQPTLPSIQIVGRHEMQSA